MQNLPRCYGQIRRKTEAQNFRSKGLPTIAGLPVKAGVHLLNFRISKRFSALMVIAVLAAGCGDDSGDPPAAASNAPSAGSGTGTGTGGTGGSGTGGGSTGGSGTGGSGTGTGGSGTGGSGGGSPTITLSISGTPPSQILAGQSLSYTPTVSNPAGVTLTFSASNLPGWANINSSTGRVSGTPQNGHVGIYSNITVTVSGGGTSVTSPAFSVEVVAAALGSVSLTWTPPTQNTDGSSLTNLAGYKIYWGLTPSDLSNSVTVANPTLSNYVVDQLTPATWYFATKAYNQAGVESSFSNIASKTVM